jgi:hypothetical protein
MWIFERKGDSSEDSVQRRSGELGRGRRRRQDDDFELGFLASSIIKNPYSYGFFLDILSPEEKRPYYS